VLALAGRSRLRAAGPPVPEETMHSVREDVNVAKSAARSPQGDDAASQRDRSGA